MFLLLVVFFVSVFVCCEFFGLLLCLLFVLLLLFVCVLFVVPFDAFVSLQLLFSFCFCCVLCFCLCVWSCMFCCFMSCVAWFGFALFVFLLWCFLGAWVNAVFLCFMCLLV